MKRTDFLADKKIKPFALRSIVTTLIILLVVPLTIWIGWSFSDRSYYIVSALIIIYTMIPFFLSFERRKPQAREIVLLAVLCAIAVASRAAFIWFPNFKPITAIVIIAAVALGPETGFLCGALSALASNFIFGQGPWTPWQMLAFGAVGFLAGLLSKKRVLKTGRVQLCVFGGAAYMLMVGPILDTCTVFTLSSVMTLETALAIYISGIPVNIMQAGCTVLTLLLLSKPMLEKLERIKLKYGIMRETALLQDDNK